MLGKILKDPLIHFMVMGAFIFVLFYAQQDEAPTTTENVIDVSRADIERMILMWQKSWMRPPTEAELDGVIEQRVREEVLYREAKAIGLDEDDTVIRRRLAKKMDYLSSDLTAFIEPSNDNLQAYYTANQKEFKIDAMISFIQIYLNPKVRKDQVKTDAAKLKTMLNQTEGEGEYHQLGDPSLLASEYEKYTPTLVNRMYGGQFYENLHVLPMGVWSGPLSTSYGLHLIYVRDKNESAIAEFDSVRDKVKQGWLAEQRKVTNNNLYKELRKRYKVVIAPLTKIIADKTGA